VTEEEAIEAMVTKEPNMSAEMLEMMEAEAKATKEVATEER
jgi:hypothetical protein